MKNRQFIKESLEAIELAVRADKKNNSWPDHAAAQVGKVVVAGGKLMESAMDYKYKDDMTEEVQKAKMKESAILVAAMAIRFLENLK